MTEDLEEMRTVGVSLRWRDERRPNEGAPYVRDNGRDPLWDVRGGRDDMEAKWRDGIIVDPPLILPTIREIMRDLRPGDFIAKADSLLFQEPHIPVARVPRPIER